MPPRTRHARASRRLQAGVVAVFALVQALALQLWCFCGHCPRSVAIGVQAESSATEHACCRKAREAMLTEAAQVGAMDCCGDDHDVRAAPALVHAAPHLPPVAVVAWLAAQPATIEPVARATAVADWQRARGPPGPSPTLFGQRTALLV